MSALPRPRPATYADPETVPATSVVEILHGSLAAHPRRGSKHAVADPALVGEFDGPFRKKIGGSDSWTIPDEPERHLAHIVVVPGLAGGRRECMPRLPETAYINTAPDWVCEMSSPSTDGTDRHIRRTIYAPARLSDLWLLDPRAEPFETFDAIPFSLGELWPFGLTAAPAEASASASTTTDT